MDFQGTQLPKHWCQLYRLVCVEANIPIAQREERFVEQTVPEARSHLNTYC